DVGYQQAVLALWNGRVKGLANGIGKQSQGQPTVAWAGTTSAGPAALVVQLATLPESPGTDPADSGRARTLIGFIGVDSKAQPRLVSYDYWHSGTTGDGIVGWFADSARQGLVVRDIGVPVGWSFSANSERFEALPGGNGATAVRVPDGIDPAQVRVHRLPYDRAEADLPIAEPVSGAAGTTEPTPFLSWPVAPMFLSAGSQLADPQSVFGTALTRKGGVATASGAPQLLATGRDSGEEVLIGVAAKNGIGRIFTVLIDAAGRTTVLDGGVIDPQANLPIMVRLPDHRGWAVVRGQAGFEWRAKTGRWHEGGQYAAILPETAVKVRITPYWGTGQQASVWLR
ncbi:MAG TPA: hypothetical protein VLL08_27470, partial [Kineosporiaceae bacterium]|nr:hypothetical protein [Kineosporiaceae bacterium]